jgi:hypothetical protein
VARTADWSTTGRRKPKAEAPKAPKKSPRPFRQPYCSSDDFYRWLATYYPWLLVPEHDVVFVGEGRPCWGPEREAEPIPPADPDAPATCPTCGDQVEPGSAFVCPACKRSGFDRKLDRQVELAGVPPPQRETPEAPQPYEPADPVPADPLARWWRNFGWARQRPPGSRRQA